jgi:hypothetical protein
MHRTISLPTVSYARTYALLQCLTMCLSHIPSISGWSSPFTLTARNDKNRQGTLSRTDAQSYNLGLRDNFDYLVNSYTNLRPDTQTDRLELSLPRPLPPRPICSLRRSTKLTREASPRYLIAFPLARTSLRINNSLATLSTLSQPRWTRKRQSSGS